MPLANPAPELITERAWQAALRLKAVEGSDYNVVPNFLTDRALAHFAMNQFLADMPIDPPEGNSDNLEFAVTEALCDLAELHLGTDDLGDNLDFEWSDRNRHSDIEAPHMDERGTFFMLTTHQETGSDGQDWTIRLWPKFRLAPATFDPAPEVAVELLARLGGEPIDVPLPSGTLFVLGGSAIKASTGDYSLAHCVLRPTYAGETRVVRKRLKVFVNCGDSH